MNASSLRHGSALPSPFSRALASFMEQQGRFPFYAPRRMARFRVQPTAILVVLPHRRTRGDFIVWKWDIRMRDGSFSTESLRQAPQERRRLTQQDNDPQQPRVGASGSGNGGGSDDGRANEQDHIIDGHASRSFAPTVR